ncbi:hypothetical protein AJ87_18545 [Rhizobium yanglingense]|nr:hypothetical protein AJ87_18545 [Rhizobium yanglingense]
MPENKEIGGGEGPQSRFTRKDDGEFCAHRHERAAASGLQSRDRSTEPGRNLLERPENQAFPVIQATDMLICTAISIYIDKRWLSMVRTPTYKHTMWRTAMLI